MVNRRTLKEAVYGPPPGAEAVVAIWNAGLVNQLLTAVWEVYDVYYASFLSKIVWTENLANVERAITEEFFKVLNRQLDPLISVDVVPGANEEESRSIIYGKAITPQYDIAFVWRANPHTMWPLEAKVIKSDKNTKSNLNDYINTIDNRFLSCKYAPFSDSAAMLVYLKSGNAETVIQHIGTRLSAAMNAYPEFPSRCHKTSDHQRVVPAGKDYPIHFRLHHLVFPLTATNSP